MPYTSRATITWEEFQNRAYLIPGSKTIQEPIASSSSNEVRPELTQVSEQVSSMPQPLNTSQIATFIPTIVEVSAPPTGFMTAGMSDPQQALPVSTHLSASTLVSTRTQNVLPVLAPSAIFPTMLSTQSFHPGVISGRLPASASSVVDLSPSPSYLPQFAGNRGTFTQANTTQPATRVYFRFYPSYRSSFY
jgi:hypothetical protein